MIIMDTFVVKNYSKCPLKKRPVLMEQDVNPAIDEQCEPENLSTKPQDLSIKNSKHSEKSSDHIVQPRNLSFSSPTELPAPATNCSKSRTTSPAFLPYTPHTIESPNYKQWHSPLTPPMYVPSTGINENIDPTYLHSINHHNLAYDNSYYHNQFRYCKEESLFKNLPIYNSYDVKTNFNNSIIKSDTFLNPKRFTPLRVDQKPPAYPHQPLFNIFPLSPSTSSQTSTYSSYDSPRGSISPVSTHSSLSAEHSGPVNFTVDASGSQSEPKINTKKSVLTKNSHYQCPDCAKSYSTYSGLSKHLQFHCPAVEGNQMKKSFSCKNCNKVYTSLGALKMHIRTHTLPCKCDICGKAFSRPWLLQGHIRTHTGEKPFSCQHCHRAFADRSNLRAHLQTHSEIKKYSCETCSKTFSRMSLLTKHMEVGCPGGQKMPSTTYHDIHFNHHLPTNLNIPVY